MREVSSVLFVPGVSATGSSSPCFRVQYQEKASSLTRHLLLESLIPYEQVEKFDLPGAIGHLLEKTHFKSELGQVGSLGMARRKRERPVCTCISFCTFALLPTRSGSLRSIGSSFCFSWSLRCCRFSALWRLPTPCPYLLAFPSSSLLFSLSLFLFVTFLLSFSGGS